VTCILTDGECGVVERELKSRVGLLRRYCPGRFRRKSSGFDGVEAKSIVTEEKDGGGKMCTSCDADPEARTF
jgi:hypothetical protein